MLNEDSAAAIFHALSYPPRMVIVRLLAEHPDGLSGIEIADMLEARRNTITTQLLTSSRLALQ